MSQQHQSIVILSVLGLILASLVGCQVWDRHERTPTAPGAESSEVANYAQMHDGSTVVDGQQINWVVSAWGAFPYRNWVYVEVNQQDAVGQPPGEHQVPVTLGNVVLHFSDLPDEVTQILIGVKAGHDDTDDTFTEIARFAVVAGSVSIPLAYGDLIYYFGVTHYSIWFQVLGGDNDEGIACGHIALSGVMPGGQGVNLSKRVCVGTHPASTPSPASTTPPVVVVPGNVAPVASGVSISGTLEVGQTLTGNYTYTDADGDPEGTSTYQWYRADDAAGTNSVAIAGATSQTYTLKGIDFQHYLRFEVIPVAASGTSPGSAAQSGWSGAVACAAGGVNGDFCTHPGEGTVTQISTGKMWIQDANAPPGLRRWDQSASPPDGANAYCNNLSLAGYTDWRLPEPSELKDELYNGGITCSTMGPFVNVQCFWYWGTDTNDPPTYTGLPAGFAWYVHFDYGGVYYDVKDVVVYVWCVRG